MKYKILLFYPNLIGYARILLLILAFYNIQNSEFFIITYSTSITLDAFDGFLARKFNQCSQFGALLDVLIDNIGRGLLWSHLNPLFYLMSAWEWLTFLCNQQGESHWKAQFEGKSKQAELPKFISNIFANNFRNFWGIWSIAGLHVLPVWLFGGQRNIFDVYSLPDITSTIGLVVLGSGRLVCFTVEAWCVWRHLLHLLEKSS